MFQSTPVTADGRTTRVPHRPRRGKGFQSTPVTADGRTLLVVVLMARVKVFQSTPVTADGRTPSGTADIQSSASFNPRPSLLTGEPQYQQH